MNLLESVRVALRSVASNKLRSALTMLGMIIGVAAVIALVAAGAGTAAAVAERFQSLGSNLLVISPAMTMFRGIAQGTSGQDANSRRLTNDDVQAIQRLSTYVSAVAPEYSSSAQVAFGSSNTQATVLGVTADYVTVREWPVERGRFVDALDQSTRAKTVVLGSSVVESLFGQTLIDPLGKMVKINRENYEIVGIMTEKGAGAQNLDNSIFVPLSTAQARFGGAGNRSLSAINVQVVSSDHMDIAQSELAAILRASHRLTAAQSDDFTIQNQAQLLTMVQETTQTFSVLLGSIASISLVVGGIGIMNIMLVSVTERTREIGIRKAIGAKRRDILSQFLIEAVVLSMAGGLLGVLCGYGGAQVVAPLLGASQALVTAQSVALALGVSVAVGLFFGIYPANRAASLHPIEALRYE